MTSTDLLERIRDQKRIEVAVGHITFYGKCPSYSKIMAIIRNNNIDDISDACIAHAAITGWKGVTEADLVDDGDESKSVEFTPELWREMIFDRRNWWVPISSKVVDAAKTRQMVKVEEAKNSPAGTTQEPSSD